MNELVEEFFGHVNVRGMNWCLVDLSRDSGFQVRHGECAHIHLVLEGRVRLGDGNGRSVNLSEGEATIRMPGDVHELRSGASRTMRPIDQLAKPTASDTPALVAIGVGQRACRLLSGRLRIDWPGGNRPPYLPRGLSLNTGDLGLVIGRLVRAPSTAGAAAVLDSAAGLLLIAALRQRLRDLDAWLSSFPDPVLRASVLIEKFPFLSWSVGVLADRVGLDRSRFTADFLARTGKTPMHALAEERMKYAVQFLRDTDLKIGEVGERIGYQSQSAFVRQFTKHFHVTPSGLRKQAMCRIQ